MKFKYFDTSASLQVTGDKMRVTADSPLVLAYTEMGHPEITFKEWFDAFDEGTRSVWLEGAPEGTFLSDWGEGSLPLSLETGEPVE